MKTFTIAALSLTLSACAPMNFVNGPVIGDTVKREHWHHLAGVGLIELSEPFNMDYYCDNKEWEKISVQLTVPNVLASASALYNPWTIYYECRDSID